MAKKKAKKRKSVKGYEEKVVEKEEDTVECYITVTAVIDTTDKAMDFVRHIQKKYPIRSFKVDGHRKEGNCKPEIFNWIKYDAHETGPNKW